MTFTIDTDGARLRLEVRLKPEIRAAAEKRPPPDHEPFDFGLLPGASDEYIITSGAFKGQRGFFTRDARARRGSRSRRTALQPDSRRPLSEPGTRKIAARSAQTLNARNASAAWSPTAPSRSHRVLLPAS